MTENGPFKENPARNGKPIAKQKIDQDLKRAEEIAQESVRRVRQSDQYLTGGMIPPESTPKKKDATRPRNKALTEQDVGTDPLFWAVLNAHYGFKWDLACTRENQLCPMGLTPGEDSLTQDWHTLENWLFLNPPFKDIKPWARKCYEESQQGAKIVLLTPASVGSNWFRDWIWKKATVRFLNGRLKFKGHDKPYPKDLMVSIFEPRMYRGTDIWTWREGWK